MRQSLFDRPIQRDTAFLVGIGFGLLGAVAVARDGYGGSLADVIAVSIDGGLAFGFYFLLFGTLPAAVRRRWRRRTLSQASKLRCSVCGTEGSGVVCANCDGPLSLAAPPDTGIPRESSTSRRRLTLAVGGAVVVLALAGIVAGREDVEPTAALATATQGCEVMWVGILDSARSGASDADMRARLRGFRGAFRGIDPVQASNIDDMIDARSAAEVSDTMVLALRRCVRVYGWRGPNKSEMDELLELERARVR